MRDQFAKAGVFVHTEPGDVFRLKDSAIKFIGHIFRTKHDERFGLVLSNDTICADESSPLVTVAPLSHITTIYHKADLLVDETLDNGLTVKSRLILSHIQPVLKTDLRDRVGKVSLDQWEKILERILWNFDKV